MADVNPYWQDTTSMSQLCSGFVGYYFNPICWSASRSDWQGYTVPPEPTSLQNLNPGNTPAVPASGSAANQAIDSILKQNTSSIQAGMQNFFGTVPGNSDSLSSLSWIEIMIGGIAVVGLISMVLTPGPRKYGR